MHVRQKQNKTRFAANLNGASRRAQLTFALLIGVSSSLSTNSMAQQAQVQINLPAQPLGAALDALSKQTGLRVYYTQDMVAGKQAAAVNGILSPSQALGQLLQGQQLETRRDGSGFIVVRATDENDPAAGGTTTMATVTVQAAIDPIAEEFNPPTTIGSRVPMTAREIPQSVTIIPQEQIQTQNMRTLDDAMRMAPSVFVQKADSTRTAYFARGFEVDNIMVDGIPTQNTLASFVPSLTAYQRVEYLSGPSGLLNGIGGPGGAINLVRKKPTREFQFESASTVGNLGNFAQDIDVSGPLNKEGTLRGRLSGSVLNQDTVRDGTHRNDGSLYGILEYDLSSNTTLRGGFSYDRLNVKDQYDGYPTDSNGKLLQHARNLYLGADWNRQTYKSTNIFGEIEHKFDNGWSSKFSVNYTQNKFDSKLLSPSDVVDVDTNTVLMRNVQGDGKDDQYSFDWFADGPFQLFGRTHKLTVGATYLKDKLYQSNQYLSEDDPFGFASYSIWDVQNVPKPAFDGPLLRRTTRTTQKSLYANSRWSLADPLTLILGGRLTWWENDFRPDQNANFFNFTGTNDKVVHHATPYAGLIYDVNDHNSLYTSFTEIFAPQSQRDASGELLQPLKGEQYEVGWKGEYYEGRLNTSLALFQLTQKNRAQLDPTDPTGATYFAQGKARARGIEATASGQVLPNWDVMTSYTYTLTKYLDDSTNSTSAFSAIAPKHMFKLWTSYRLPGDLNKWTVGGDLYVSSKTSSELFDPLEGSIKQGGYALVGARVGYDINKHVSASLQVSNLFNRYYYARLGDQFGGNWIGDPRTVMLTMRVKY